MPERSVPLHHAHRLIAIALVFVSVAALRAEQPTKVATPAFVLVDPPPAAAPAAPVIAVAPSVAAGAPSPAPVSTREPVRPPAPRVSGVVRKTGTRVPVVAATESMIQRANRLLAQVDYPWRSLGYSVVFTGPRTGYLGETDPRSGTITVFVRPGHTDAELLATLGHEIGHAVDFTYGVESRRAEYRLLRGLPRSMPWFPCDACVSDFASSAGDFAEVFSLWLTGPHPFLSQVASRPSTTLMAALAHLFVAPPVDVAAAVAAPVPVTVLHDPSAYPWPSPRPWTTARR